MSGKQTVVGKVISDYCRRFPSVSSKALAQLLIKNEPRLFHNYDSTRSLIRYYRGSRGGEARGHRERNGGIIPHLKLPSAVKSDWKPFILSDDVKRWLLIADLHIPFHEPKPLRKTLEYAKKADCDGVLIDGDLMDCYSLSSWVRDPRLRKPKNEVQSTKEFLYGLRDYLQPKRIVWKGSNHEHRLELYLMQHAADLWEMDPEYFSWPKILGLDSMGVEWVDWMNVVRHHALTILHGDEWKGWHSVNPARTAFLRAMDCTITAHYHQGSRHEGKTLLGRDIRCWSLPCLCQLHPAYARLNDWGWGFAILHSGHQWYVEERHIIKGEVV